MSIEAINWALNHAPIPTDRKDASALAITLIALANHAGPDGTEAFPSVERLTVYTRLSRRTVQRSLRSLEELGLIRPGNPRYRDARIERADLRPQVYDLVLSAGLSTGSPDGAPARRPVDLDGASAERKRGVSSDRTGRQHDARNVLNRPGNRPSREHAPEARSLTPECGQCDARPGDPVSARVVWLDADRNRSTPCPLCNPAVTR